MNCTVEGNCNTSYCLTEVITKADQTVLTWEELNNLTAHFGSEFIATWQSKLGVGSKGILV
jgi:hypothetical protein